VSISIGNLIAWPYTAESYPTRIRAVGLGVASATARGASMLTPLLVGGILSQSGSVRLVFGVLGACALTAFVLWLTATRETARMSLDSLT
jgi:putative MFS transporter